MISVLKAIYNHLSFSRNNQQSEQKSLTIAITGAAGMISYSLYPLLLSGDIFGSNTSIHLRLLDIPQCLDILQGIKLELQDFATPLLKSVLATDDPNQAFKDVDLAIFIGGFPRKEGMERKDLLQINGGIFKAQGKALNLVAKKDVKILVVANPANTNCLLLKNACPNIPIQNFTCLTRLDQNRSYGLIGEKLNLPVDSIKDVYVWGNHSTTMYPDVSTGKVNGQSVNQLCDLEWIQGAFCERVQKRGGEILKARKGTSVMSAAFAIRDHLKDWWAGSDQIVSMGIVSEGWYDVHKGIVFSFPCKCLGQFKHEVVTGLKLDEFSKNKLHLTEKELLEERQDAIQQ